MNFPLYFSHDDNYCGTLFSRLFRMFVYLPHIVHSFAFSHSGNVYLPQYSLIFISLDTHTRTHATYNYCQSQFRCYIRFSASPCEGFIQNALPDEWHITRETERERERATGKGRKTRAKSFYMEHGNLMVYHWNSIISDIKQIHSYNWWKSGFLVFDLVKKRVRCSCFLSL